ncbi:MAG: hypothetical protein AB7P20_17445 [Rhizobiaceae bacterium]
MRKLPLQDDEILLTGNRSLASRSGAGPRGGTVRVGSPAPALRFEWTDWLPHLEDQDVSDEQKRALIETLWSIVVAFVDLGWRLNPPAESSGETLDLKAILTEIDPGTAKEAE